MLRRLFFQGALIAGASVALSASVMAQLSGPGLEFSPYGGAAIWGRRTFLDNSPLFGGRVHVGFLPFVGLEGTYGWSQSKVEDFEPEEKITAHHVGADLSLDLAPSYRVSPYVLGGWTQLFVNAEDLDPDPLGLGPDRRKFNGWEMAGGLRIELAEGTGHKVSLRLEARDVMAKFDPPAPIENEWHHNAFVTAGLSFAFGSGADDDRDGVRDKLDACPDTPYGARVDARGCPVDGDSDGVADGLDQCDGTPVGATVDSRGCPSDADGDQVFDGIDQCEATPAGARVDAQGCPADGDKDGVPDGLDKCENTPVGATVDASGCPSDEDGDGVPDGVDRCAATPAGTRIDAFGCPITEKEVELLDTGLLRIQEIYFDTAKSTLRPESHRVLDEVGAILVKWPQLKIEIGAHADSRGSDAYNRGLSEERAQSVLAYLVSKFPDISREQYTPVGYGESQPVAPNNTADGQRQNRRVEFKVLNREVLRK